MSNEKKPAVLELPPLCECLWKKDEGGNESRILDPKNLCKVAGHEKPSEKVKVKRKENYIGF